MQRESERGCEWRSGEGVSGNSRCATTVLRVGFRLEAAAAAAAASACVLRSHSWCRPGFILMGYLKKYKERQSWKEGIGMRKTPTWKGFSLQ